MTLIGTKADTKKRLQSNGVKVITVGKKTVSLSQATKNDLIKEAIKLDLI